MKKKNAFLGLEQRSHFITVTGRYQSKAAAISDPFQSATERLLSGRRKGTSKLRITGAPTMHGRS